VKLKTFRVLAPETERTVYRLDVPTHGISDAAHKRGEEMLDAALQLGRRFGGIASAGHSSSDLDAEKAPTQLRRFSRMFGAGCAICGRNSSLATRPGPVLPPWPWGSGA